MADDPRGGEERVASGVTLDGISYWYQSRGSSVHALDDISLSFARGEFVAIVGPSGCGKSTLLQLLAGFRTPTSGVASVFDAVVDGPAAERGVVFQSPNLYPWLTVAGNVRFGPSVRGVAKAEREARTTHYLELVGLTPFADHRPYELSGGMQQRAQIARVLANDPELLLMDEPFAALDALTRERLQQELHRIWLETRKTVVFVTHNVEEAVYLATRVLVMSPRPGRIVFDRAAPFARSGADLETLRATPAFVELQREVRSAIVDDAPGLVTPVPG